MPNPHSRNRTKPSARRGRKPSGERPAARAPVARGVFGHATEPASARESGMPVPQEQPAATVPPRLTAKGSEPTTGKRPKPSTEGAVLVTGVCGRLGKLLARELHRTDHVVGVDRRSFDDLSLIHI